MLLFVATIFNTSANENNVYDIDVVRGEAIIQDSIQSIATITSASDKYQISIGGNINMRANYDFNGAINHPDFITSLIPTPATFDSQRRFYLDATTSRIEIKGHGQTDMFGDVELCLNADFRGGGVGSYTPRVRLAYISVSGFTVGRNFTTFCDMGAAAPNIDFQGPSVCPYIYTTQIRYTHNILNDRVTLGAALEYHAYQSSTLGDEFAFQQQYIPSIPAYVQFNWGGKRADHIRLTALYKSIPLYELESEKNININGWGTQLSGSLGAGEHLKFYYSATCGEGITEYMQDTYGSGLDVTTTNGLRTTFMYGWQAAALVQVSSRTMISAGYSQVIIEGENSHFAPTDFRQSDYLFANIFYSLSSRIQLATEFLWGARRNVNGERNTANRINSMIQYNF